MEKKVNELIEESCFANDRGEFALVRKIKTLYIVGLFLNRAVFS